MGPTVDGLKGTVLLKTGILNPAINSLLSRVRHTNTLVIADRGFPFWPGIEIIDISLTDDIPRVLDVLSAVLPVFRVGRVFMADEFKLSNSTEVALQFAKVLGTIPVFQEPHNLFKKRIPSAIGLIRTSDTTQFANILLESA